MTRAKFPPVGGMGLVRACVAGSEGTSNLDPPGAGAGEVWEAGCRRSRFAWRRFGSFRSDCSKPGRGRGAGDEGGGTVRTTSRAGARAAGGAGGKTAARDRSRTAGGHRDADVPAETVAAAAAARGAVGQRADAAANPVSPGRDHGLTDGIAGVEEALVLVQEVAVCHAGEVIAHGALEALAAQAADGVLAEERGVLHVGIEDAGAACGRRAGSRRRRRGGSRDSRRGTCAGRGWRRARPGCSGSGGGGGGGHRRRFARGWRRWPRRCVEMTSWTWRSMMQRMT